MRKTAGILLLIASIISIVVHIVYFFRNIYYMFEYTHMGGMGASSVFFGFLEILLPVALLIVAIWMMKGDGEAKSE
jgi:hypothetical protein